MQFNLWNLKYIIAAALSNWKKNWKTMESKDGPLTLAPRSPLPVTDAEFFSTLPLSYPPLFGFPIEILEIGYIKCGRDGLEIHGMRWAINDLWRHENFNLICHNTSANPHASHLI